MNRLLIVFFAASTLTLTTRTGATVDAAPARAEITRKVYFTANDAKGAPVTDLTAADVTVKEGGTERKVGSLQPAVAPMHVAILVDDAGTGAFQIGVAQFIQNSLGRGQFSISLLSPQARKIVDFTENVDMLKSALGELKSRGKLDPDGDQMPEAIADISKAWQKQKVERPVIVAMTMLGGQLHALQPKDVLDALRLSGASLHVLYYTGADLGQVLGDGPKQSGGRIEEALTGQAIAPAAAKIADALQHQYLLTYTLPDGVKMADRIAVTTSRKGVVLTAPSRIAEK